MAEFSPTTNAVAIPNVVAVAETAKAIDVRFGTDLHLSHWIPKGQIQPGAEVRHLGDRGLLIVSKWFAMTAKLIPAEERASAGVRCESR